MYTRALVAVAAATILSLGIVAVPVRTAQASIDGGVDMSATQVTREISTLGLSPMSRGDVHRPNCPTGTGQAYERCLTVRLAPGERIEIRVAAWSRVDTVNLRVIGNRQVLHHTISLHRGTWYTVSNTTSNRHIDVVIYVRPANLRGGVVSLVGSVM